MAETPQNTKNGDIPCIIVYCENPNGTSCPDTCLPSVDPYFLPPPLPPQPPPLPPPPSSSSHLAPFLIAIVCILGISFLLLTTCTIIFRYRFSRRRHEDRHTVSNINHNHDDDDHSFVDHPIWHITTVGLHQSVIDSITAFKYKKIDGFFVEGSSDTSCSVCLTEFEDGDDLRMLPKCCHPFHQNCIDTWLRSHKNCPLCRAPVVNEGLVVPEADHVVVVSGTLNGGESERMNLSNGSEVSSSSSSSNRADDITRLPVLEGIKIAEILRRNHEFRIFSDLGDHRRFREVEMVDYAVDSVRRSVSFNSMAASAKSGAVIGCSNGGGSKDGSSGEGCSREANFGGVLHQQKKSIDLEKGGNSNNNNNNNIKRGSSMSGLLIKSFSNGRSLQKGPVPMKRSLSSSSSRFFSFRRSKSQASVLPL